MDATLLLLLGIAVPLTLVGGVIRFAWPPPRINLSVQVLLVAVVPLALLSVYLVSQYKARSWSVFPYGSLTPHVIAAVIFLIGLVAVVLRARGPTHAKALLAAVAPVGWAILCFITALFTACLMGDCL